MYTGVPVRYIEFDNWSRMPANFACIFGIPKIFHQWYIDRSILVVDSETTSETLEVEHWGEEIK